MDELGPYLKWSTRAELTRTLKARKKETKSFEAELTRLSADDPKILEKLVSGGILIGAHISVARVLATIGMARR